LVGQLACGVLVAAALVAANHFDELRGWLELRAASSPAERKVLEKAGECDRMRRQDPVGALALVDSAVRQLEAGPPMHDRLATRLYTLKGDLHWDLYQYVDAVASWERAEARASPSEHVALENRVFQTQRHIEKMNPERNQHSVYLAAPNVGPAAILTGEIVVAYVFVQDQGGGAWSLRDRSLALTSWVAAEAWLAARARQYGAGVHFTRRLFVVDRNPTVRRLRVGWERGSWNNDARVARLVAQQLGALTVLAFLDHLRHTARADQAVLVLHIQRDDRSVAWKCIASCGPDGEFAYVLEPVTPKGWDDVSYAQAHETLHLFGADDLYNLRGAGSYAPRDIMHYPSRLLSASTLEAITAFATGLRRDRPAAPFRIVKR